jgi:uncharacterized protein YoxC
MIYWIVGVAVAMALILLGMMIYRVVKEVRPTIQAANKAVSTLQQTVEQSQEIVYRMNSISGNLAEQSINIQIIRALAADSIEQVKDAASLVKPIQYTYRGIKTIYHSNGAARDWVEKLKEKFS